MNRITQLLVIALIVFGGNTLGQVTGLKPMPRPIKYVNPAEGVSLSADSRSSSFRPGSIWIVFSDRENNKTYTSVNGGQLKDVLNMFEPYVVAEEQGEWVHIVKDNSFSNTDLESSGTLSLNSPSSEYRHAFSAAAKDCGWIKKDNLLLWQKCLTTRIGDFKKKGMILNTVETTLKRDLDTEKSNEVYFFKNPETSNRSDIKSRVYEVLYIYKIDETNSSVLLGRSDRIMQADAQNYLLGWMKLENVTIWDTRIACEPNWNQAAAMERRSGTSAKIFRTETQAFKYTGKQIWDQDPFEKRNIGQWRRFPVLSPANQDGVIRVGVMGELTSSIGNLGEVEWATVREKYNAMRTKQSRINVIFVVDGTKSMQPYFRPISNAINNSMKELRTKSQNTGQNIKFGAVVYTDYAEDQYNKLTQIKRIDTYSGIADWMGSMSTFHRSDSDTPEAVFKGILEGIRGTGISKDETNVVVLVGDAGNHHRNDASQVDVDMLAKSLARFNCNVCAIQVHHEYDQSYKEFKTQMKDLIKKTALIKYQENQEMYSKFDYQIPQPKWISISPNNEILDTTTVIGSVLSCAQGQTISPDNVELEIEKIVNSSYNLTMRKLNIIQDVLERGGDISIASNDGANLNSTGKKASFEEASVFTPAVLDYLRALDIEEDKLKILMKENYQMYIPGYTRVKIDGQENPLFNYVLFMSNQEMGNLLSVFDDLIDATNGHDQRSRMKDVWMKLLEKHIGDEFTPQEAENMTMEEVNKKIFGLPGRSALLNRKLGHLTDRSIVSDDEMFRYIQAIAMKRQDLTKIFNMDNYPYSFMSNDTKYFWVDQSLLP